MSTSPTVIVSGCHSGPNPSPGLGIARSLRAAYPQARLIGRDFSPRSTGIHSELFDECWLSPPETDRESMRAEILARLANAWLLSALDAEVRRLAGLEHPAILSPSTEALLATSKPAFPKASMLPVRVPAFEILSADEQQVHRFCLVHNWSVWAKGGLHGAERISSWPQLQETSEDLARRSGASNIFLQQHIEGPEVSIAFAAFCGQLLGAALLEKRLQTEAGKAWGGTFHPLPETLASGLQSVVERLGWTGGGELEFVRDSQGTLWLLDWNPRFPAWIHGATLCGLNLPARLLARARGEALGVAQVPTGGFVRVVEEMPLRAGLELPQLPAEERLAVSSKQLLAKLSGGLAASRAHAPANDPTPLPSSLIQDLLEVSRHVTGTPNRMLLPRTAVARLETATQLASRHRLLVAYSIKTNPDPEFLRLAHQRGLLAEVISAEEIAHARACGWESDQLIFNGPVPPPEDARSLGAIFADDLDAFERSCHREAGQVVGLRLRPPRVASRFGFPIDESGAMDRLVDAFRGCSASQRLGISFHVASSAIGVSRWMALAASIAGTAAVLRTRSGRSIDLVSLGGGWHPHDFDRLDSVLAGLVLSIRSVLGEQVAILLEPGKALAQPSFALVTRVLQVRSAGSSRQAILDGGINLVPHLRAFPHRLALLRDGEVLPSGTDVLLGPLCMEEDCLGEVSLPPDVGPGDLVAILDAGGYDASMAYRFAKGAANRREGPECRPTNFNGEVAGHASGVSYHQDQGVMSTSPSEAALISPLAENNK